MKLFIPTYKRTETQRTWDNLPTFAKEMTALVCPKSEAAVHRARGRTVFAAPDTVKGIAATRQWIVENAGCDQVMMADDDQNFSCREEGTYKLRPMEEDDFRAMFDEVRSQLQTFNAVGISAQAGNNRTFPKTILSPGRMYNMYAFNRAALTENNIRFDKMKVMEDFHVTLSMLRLGMPNAILQNWCWSQPASNADGGCSEYRTAKLQEANAFRLAELHHPFVKIVRKKSDSWGNGLSTRTDVRVYWKRALEAGLRRAGKA